VEKLQGGLGFWAGNGGSSITKILGLLLKVSSYDLSDPKNGWGGNLTKKT
jgi:hypothetical protein